MKHLLAILFLTSAIWHPTSAVERPNIVYILADDMGYGDIAALNPECKFPTPHLDAMAAKGMHFTDAHSSSSVCTPTRYGILTGRYNWRSRLKSSVLFGYSPHLITEDRLTVPGMLRDSGYQTACVGKWHLGFDWHPSAEGADKKKAPVDFTQPITHGPTHRGFDTFFGISASLDMPPYVYIRDDKAVMVPTAQAKGFGRGGLAAEGLTPDAVLPDLTAEAVKVIAESAKKDAPFFLYFPLPAPHTPIAPTKEWQGKSGLNPYADFCMQVDGLVGQVAAALEEQGITDNTLFIFTADNGCSPRAEYAELAKHGHDPSYHFRGHKADIYEGGHRVAFIAQWPERVTAGSRSDQTICLTDLMATAADIVDAKLPDTAGEDSVSILPALLGKDGGKPLREAVVHHSINGSFAIRQGKWKLCLCPGSGGWSEPRPGKVDMTKMPAVQLYDLEADIAEENNLQGQHPEVVKKLTGLLENYVARGRSTPGADQPNDGEKIVIQKSPAPPKKKQGK